MVLKITEADDDTVDNKDSDEEVAEQPKKRRGRPPKSDKSPKTKASPKKKAPVKKATPAKKQEKKRKASEVEDTPEEEADEEEQQWEVETILLDRYNRKNRIKEFFIKWKGFGIDKSTWEPSHTIKEDLPELVAKYLKEYKPQIPKEFENIQDGDYDDNPVPLRCTKLLNKRRKSGTKDEYEYEVKWKYYPVTTWESADLLPDQAITKYDLSLTDAGKSPAKKKQKKQEQKEDDEKEIPNGEDDAVTPEVEKEVEKEPTKNITIVGDKDGYSIFTIKSGDDEPVDQSYEAILKEHSVQLSNYLRGKLLDAAK